MSSMLHVRFVASLEEHKSFKVFLHFYVVGVLLPPRAVDVLLGRYYS